MPALISERPRCEAVRSEAWVQSPHDWRQCKNAAHKVRGGTPVCSNHAHSDVFVRFDTPEARRPTWRNWYT